MAVYPQHLLLSRRLLRSPWIPQMVSDPRVHDFEGRLNCRGLHAHGLGAAGPDVCHSGPARVGVGVCGHHGVRIELHAFHSDHIFWSGNLGPVFSREFAKGNCTWMSLGAGALRIQRGGLLKFSNPRVAYRFRFLWPILVGPGKERLERAFKSPEECWNASARPSSSA